MKKQTLKLMDNYKILSQSKYKIIIELKSVTVILHQKCSHIWFLFLSCFLLSRFLLKATSVKSAVRNQLSIIFCHSASVSVNAVWITVASKIITYSQRNVKMNHNMKGEQAMLLKWARHHRHGVSWIVHCMHSWCNFFLSFCLSFFLSFFLSSGLLAWFFLFSFSFYRSLFRL